MSRRLAVAALGVLALVGAGAVAGVVWNSRGHSANQATPTGIIALAASGTHLTTPADLYVAEADGSKRQLLTRCPIGKGDALWLNYPFGCIVQAFAWSPNGRWLAFLRGRQGGATVPTDLSLYVVDHDGAHERRLPGCGGPKWPSCGDFFGSEPTWAPGSSQLIVTRRGRLLRFDVERGVYHRVTHGCRPRVCFDMNPAWSPDGSRIVFARTQGPRARSLYSVKADGSRLTRLTDLPGWSDNPQWSPNGRRILFDNWDESGRRIYVIAADGSGLTVLARGSRFSGPAFPSWSPDGTQILYLATQAPHETRFGPGPDATTELRVIDSSATNATRLYQFPGNMPFDARPTWSPDGSYISFASVAFDEDENTLDQKHSGTFVIRSDGTGVRKVLHFPTEVAWKPVP